MKQNKTKNLQSILQNSQLKQLYAKSDALNALQAIMLECLPAPMNTQCWVANARKNTLVLNTVNAAWANKLTYLERDILYALNDQGFEHIKKIQVKVSKNLEFIPESPKLKTRKRNQLSAENAEMLLEMAEDMQDEALAESLRKLAKRADTSRQA